MSQFAEDMTKQTHCTLNYPCVTNHPRIKLHSINTHVEKAFTNLKPLHRGTPKSTTGDFKTQMKS